MPLGTWPKIGLQNVALNPDYLIKNIKKTIVSVSLHTLDRQGIFWPKLLTESLNRMNTNALIIFQRLTGPKHNQKLYDPDII